MNIVLNLRPGAARMAGLGVAATLAAVSAGGAAKAEGAPRASSSLSQVLFAPVQPTATSTVGPLLSPQARAELQQELARPIRKAGFVPGAPVRATAAGAARARTLGGGLDFGYPLPGHAVNSRFGLRQLSFEPRARMHDGVDIAAPIGSAIHAAAQGVVTRTGVSSSYGRFVELRHADGLSTFYAHMSRTAGLAPGAEVREGEVLGFVGSTGHSTGPHLHFEVRKDGEPLDPQAFMGRAFASAADLPLAGARAPGAFTAARHPMHTLAVWRHGRGHMRPLHMASAPRGRVRWARG